MEIRHHFRENGYLGIFAGYDYCITLTLVVCDSDIAILEVNVADCKSFSGNHFSEHG